MVPEKVGFLDSISVLPFVHTFEIGKCPGQDSAGSQLSFGSGSFVIISEIIDHNHYSEPL